MQSEQCTNGFHHMVPAKAGSEGDISESPFHHCTWQQGDGRLLIVMSPSVDEVKHNVPFIRLSATTELWQWSTLLAHLRPGTKARCHAAQPQLCVSDLHSAFPKQLCMDHCPHLFMQLSQKSFPSYPMVSLGGQQGEKNLLCKSKSQ